MVSLCGEAGARWLSNSAVRDFVAANQFLNEYDFQVLVKQAELLFVNRGLQFQKAAAAALCRLCTKKLWHLSAGLARPRREAQALLVCAALYLCTRKHAWARWMCLAIY